MSEHTNNSNQAASLNCIPALLQSFVTGAFFLGGTVSVIFILLAGIKYIRSGGDRKQVEDARATLTYAIVGLIILFSSFVILRLIATVTGISCFLNVGFGSCQ